MPPRKSKLSKAAKARFADMDRLGVGLREYDSMKLSRKLARQKQARKKSPRRTTR